MIRKLAKIHVTREEHSRDLISLSPDVLAPETTHVTTEAYCHSKKPRHLRFLQLRGDPNSWPLHIRHVAQCQIGFHHGFLSFERAPEASGRLGTTNGLLTTQSKAIKDVDSRFPAG